MYGGLQTSIGVVCAIAVLRRDCERIALLVLLFVFAGLAPIRVGLGLMHADFSAYNLFAMIFEAFSLAFLLWYLWPGRAVRASA